MTTTTIWLICIGVGVILAIIRTIYYIKGKKEGQNEVKLEHAEKAVERTEYWRKKDAEIDAEKRPSVLGHIFDKHGRK